MSRPLGITTKICLLLGLGAGVLAAASNGLPVFGPADLHHKDFHIRLHCRVLVANMVATKIVPDKALLNSNGWARFHEMAGEYPEHHYELVMLGILQMADVLLSLGHDHFDEVARWDEGAFTSYAKSAARNINEELQLTYGWLFFKRFGRNTLDWHRGKYRSGKNSELLDLMNDHGSSSTVYGLLGMKRTIETVAANDRTPLGDAVRALQAFDDKLTVCVLGKNCGLTKKHCALHHRFVRNMKRDDDGMVGGDPFPPMEVGERFPEVGPSVDMSVIVVPFPEKAEEYSVQLFWVSTYFHEATHFADTIREAQWIRANIILKNRGLPIDPYFTMAYRVTRTPNSPSLNFVISTPFQRAFYEASAGETEAEVARILAPANDARPNHQRRQFMARNTYNYIVSLSGERFMREHWNITEENAEEVFTIAREIRRSMDYTIARAKIADPTAMFLDW